MAKETLEQKQDIFNKKLDDLVDKGMTRTKEWVDMWQSSLRYFFSDQLHYKKLKKDWDWVTLNYIWPSAIQEIAKLAKNHPKIIASAWEDSDADVAAAWQSFLQWMWEKGINDTGMRLEQIAAILDGKLFGYRVSKVYWEDKCYWDDQQKQWMGDVKYRLWHPAEFWAGDGEKITDGACGTQRYVTLDYAIQRWPEFEKELRDEAAKYKESAGGANTIRGAIGSQTKGGVDGGEENKSSTLLNLILKTDRMGGAEVHEETDFVKLEEIYFYDYETAKIKEEQDVRPEELLMSGQAYDLNGQFYDTLSNQPLGVDNWPKQTIREYEEPLYPYGRYIIRAGHTILNPDSQRYPYKRWPFIVTPHYLLPHMWQGTDGVQLYKDTQDMINITASHLANNMKMYGDPKVAVENGAIATKPGRHADHFRVGSAAGAIIKLVKGGLSRFKIIDPPNINVAALQLYGLFSQEFKNIVGLQDIAQGIKPSGEMSATQSQYLMMSANDRISLQSAYEDEWIKCVASLIADICQTNYDVGRFVRILGDDHQLAIKQITSREKDVKFDVSIVPGATLPFDEEKRILKYKEAYALLQQPVANVMLPDMLRVLEIPNWKRLLQQHEIWQQYIQFQQLYEAVVSGQITPQQAVAALVQKATELYQQQQSTMQGQAQRNEQAVQQQNERTGTSKKS